MKKGSILAFALLAAALSQTAGAITATKEYVDRKDTEIRTNTYTKAETDARIDELAPRTSLEPATNYTDAAVAALSNAVPSIVTNEVELGYTEWELHGIPDDFGMRRYGEANPLYTVFFDPLAGGIATLKHDGEPDFDVIVSDIRDPDATFLQFYNATGIGGEYDITATRESQGTRNALSLARMADIAPSVSNTVTKSYVEDLGIKSGISASTATNIAFAVSADATNSLAASLSNNYLRVSKSEVTGSDAVDSVVEFNQPTWFYGSVMGLSFFGTSFNVSTWSGIVNNQDAQSLPEYLADRETSLTNNLATKTYVDDAIAEIPSGGASWGETNVASVISYFVGYEHVSVSSGGTLSASTNDWPNGAAVMVDLSPAGSYTVSGIHLLGYGVWPTNRAEMVVWRSGTNVIANVVLNY